VWAGIVDDVLVGSRVLPQRLTGKSYFNFLENGLPTLLKYLPYAIRKACALCMMVLHHVSALQFKNSWETSTMPDG
jgi:hypothetical protein